MLALILLGVSGGHAHASKQLEALEKYDIEMLRIDRIHWDDCLGSYIASILDSEGYVHSFVRAGQYMGKNSGRIGIIERCRMGVSELYPDGEGGWAEKPRWIEWDECELYEDAAD